jgi:hypothetical protein
VLDIVDKAQQHYYKLAYVPTRSAPVVGLGAWTKPTIGSTALSDVKNFFQKMKELMETFYEFDAYFRDFITNLMKVVPSIVHVAP